MTTRLLMIGTVLALGSPAYADGAFIEADVALAFPVADDQYTGDVDESFKLGVRVGTATKTTGFDVSFDFTPYNEAVSTAFTEVSIQRYRFMVGARIYHPIAPKARLFARFGAGLDLIHYNAKTGVLNLEQSETDPGIALEASAGILFDLGKLHIGAKLGLPMAFHFDDNDPNNNTDADLKYTSLDVDVAFVVTIPF